ncbi:MULTISPECIES: DUF58 domain-containing protein [Microbacterium]|uniref:DUF58 domain-containing protein n=1 Tax=Microbacterium trichothecenolyticum TaxID=69370 RepID=A0A0M2HBG2_MICTR|nr:MULTISPECIES: DUF58 domain-containing protein [Microbacterium]KJL41418.1 hypothetical protein RS82_02646 [Microbacterium trichothecenolyticum]MDR7190493.1 uncharacterized protein (DUF58 family) [Microbacterium sp. BE35]
MRSVWPLTVRGTGALVLAIACFIVANEASIVELMYFGILLLAVVVASIASLYVGRRSDAVTRALVPDVVPVGGDARVSVRVEVRTALPTAPGTWRDALPKGLRGKAEGAFPALGSGLRGGERGGARSIDLMYTVTGARRGVHSLGPLTVRSSDPFGLARRTVVFSQRTPVTVAPAIVELPPLVDYAGATGGMLHTTTDQLGQGADNLVARPYAPGDSMRRIHWRATAHRDELMVRQEEQESTPEAAVVIDRAALRWSPEALRAPGADPGFEAGISACVSAVARLVHDGYAVEVLDTEGTVLVDRIDGGDMTEVDAMLVHFATITAHRDDTLPRLSRLFAGASTGPIVLIVGRLDPADAVAVGPVSHHSTLPLLLSAAPVGDALDIAADHGWHVAAIGPDRDLGSAWANAIGRGVHHVFG